MPEHRFSEENSKKLDHILQLLEGNGSDAPGLIARVGLIERVLWGKESEKGLAFRVAVMWRMHVWVLCTMSGLAGAGLMELAHRFFKI